MDGDDPEVAGTRIADSEGWHDFGFAAVHEPARAGAGGSGIVHGFRAVHGWEGFSRAGLACGLVQTKRAHFCEFARHHFLIRGPRAGDLRLRTSLLAAEECDGLAGFGVGAIWGLCGESEEVRNRGIATESQRT